MTRPAENPSIRHGRKHDNFPKAPFFDFGQIAFPRRGYANDMSNEAAMHAKSTNEFNAEAHQRLHQLFQRFQSLKAADQAGAKRAFYEFKAGMERHIRQEEAILFPCFTRKCAGFRSSPVEALKRDHGQILNYLAEIARKLERSDFNTDQDEQNVESAVDFHSQSEDEELFPILDELLTEQERAIIFEALDRCE